MEKIERTYVHTGGKSKVAFGEIGSVDLGFEAKGWTLDGKPLPEQSVRAIVNHGLQILQDAYAGAEDAKAAKAAWTAKHEKLVKGELGIRGSGVDAAGKDLLKAAYESQDKLAEFKKLSDDDLAAKVAELVKNNPEAVEERRKEMAAEAEARRKANEAKKAKAAKLAEKITIDL